VGNLEDLVRLVEGHVADASQGLPEELFLLVTRLTPVVNVDLLIKDDRNRTLLTWRDDGYEYSPGWHVPGGIIRYKERSADRIQAVAAKELGASVSFRPEPIAIREVFHPARRNRGHFISLLFRCELESPPDERLHFVAGAPQNGQWAWHSGCPANLIRVHDMYRPFLE
jgi:ADP-ribose pyrophosphatase YjhB (NUDIX family)